MDFAVEPVLGLFNCGRFREALSQLQKARVRPEDPHRQTYLSLLADSLYLTGQTEAAERMAQQTCTMSAAKPSTLARCHIVLGCICRDRGDLRRSVWHSEKAFNIVQDGRDPELACRAKLRLMMVAGEMDGAEAAIALLPDIRRRVDSLANPVVSAALHLCVAEFESKRGLLANATRHIQMGRAILLRHTNVWLEGSAAIGDFFCVAFLKSDVSAALSYASQALSASVLSGHAATKMAACANLGHIYLACGEFGKAEDYFDQALACCHRGGASEVAVLDGMAQLEMARCNFTRCEEYLEQIEKIGEWVPSQAPRYYRSWACRTKLELLITQRRISEAQKLIVALRPAFVQFHPSLRLALTRLHAELLLVTGHYEAASSVLYKAYCECDAQSPQGFAYVSLSIGKALSRVDSPWLAASHLRRSARIFSYLKQSNARSEAEVELTKLLPTANNAPVSQDVLAATAARVARAQLTDSKGLGQPTDVLDQIAGLIELEEAPELLGREIFEMFRERSCTRRLTLVRDDGLRREVISCDGDYSDSADSQNPTAELALHLGVEQKNTLLLTAVPRTDFLSQLDCAAIYKVAKALVDLRGLRRESQERHAMWPADEVVPTGEAVFSAAPMVEMLRTLRKIAPSNLTVLITGETGTGKEVIARALHQQSNRVGKPFTAFNCAAVPRELVESQLFGYRRGAFSGAHDRFDGVIRAAAGGSLFLDEIGEIPHEIQPKLLRFLETSEVHPLGEPKPIHIDVRIIAATNSNLEQSVAQGSFREDLFYRLNVIRFRVPPLRERREEIPLLVNHFLQKYSEEYSKAELSMSDDVMECLLLYGWPGNVRQLANEIRRLVALADNGDMFELTDLSAELTGEFGAHRNQRKPTNDAVLPVSLSQTLNSAVEQVERAMLRHALEASAWRVEEAARNLGLSRKGLYLKRIRLGIRGSSNDGSDRHESYADRSE